MVGDHNKKSKSFFFCLHYRQWSLPASIGMHSSNSKVQQIARYKMFTNKVSLASNQGKNIVIMTDDNINSIDTNSMTNQLNNNDLKTIRDDMLINNDMIIHNDQPTFFRQNFRTCIDHIISNCPDKLTHITTYNKQYYMTNDRHTYNADSSYSDYYSSDDYNDTNNDGNNIQS